MFQTPDDDKRLTTFECGMLLTLLAILLITASPQSSQQAEPAAAEPAPDK